MLLHKKIQVLGVHGLADAGKTTAATILEDLTGFKRIAFADPVKRAAAALYNIDVHCFYKETAPENFCRNKTVIEPFNLTVRQMMRDMADALKNKHGGDFWINLTQQLIQVEVAKDPSIRGFIIEDVRYGENNPWGEAGNEQKAVHDWGGFVFHIQRPDLERTELHNSHSSEDGLAPVEGDQVVWNNSGLEDLQKTLTDLTNSLGLTKL